MDRQSLEKLLIETLREVQSLSGQAMESVTGSTCPIGQLEGFDSMRGQETTTKLSRKLNVDIRAGKGNTNIFVSKDGRRALTVSEIVIRVQELTEKENC